MSAPIDTASESEIPRQSLVIAPFLSGQYFCDETDNNPAVTSDEDAALYCASRLENGAGRIAAALDAIGPKISPSGKYRLGYTLTLPLFRFFKRVNDKWVLDAATLNENLRTISGVDRPVVIYLSSNHFIDAGKELCRELALDSVNLMWNRKGPMRPDTFFESSVIAWTLADRNAPVNVLRRQVFTAAIEAIRALPETDKEKIAGISILGEVHQIFTEFFAGPTFNACFSDASDYSPPAVAGFRSWLARKYEDVAALNSDLEADFSSFDVVNPPSKDIKNETLGSFFEHIDAYAAGTIPVYGWLHDEMGRDLTVTIYLDGKLLGAAEMGLSRTDVTEAIPKITDPNVGFCLHLDYRKIPHGIHTLEVLVSVDEMAPLRLATQQLALVNRLQEPSRTITYHVGMDALPITSDSCLSGALDGPQPWTPVFYNPLARLWLAYRNEVVRNHIEEFAQIAGRSCIGKDKLFTHQVTPALIGGWNADLLAANASKLPTNYCNPGTTLYGGAAFGAAFLAMKRELGWGRYSVSEMHPTVKLAAAEYLSMFEMHRTNGAAFVAPYFMYIGPKRLIAEGDGHNRFRIAPNNTRCGSDAYWHAIQDVMKQ